MLIDERAVLQIVATGTRTLPVISLVFNGESYNQSEKGIWLDFVQTWLTFNPEYHNHLKTGQDSVFTFSR